MWSGVMIVGCWSRRISAGRITGFRFHPPGRMLRERAEIRLEPDSGHRFVRQSGEIHGELRLRRHHGKSVPGGAVPAAGWEEIEDALPVHASDDDAATAADADLAGGGG